MLQEIPRGSESMLDRAALETQMKMRSEAPKATGMLARSIDVISPKESVRVIGPEAQYGYHQETRDNRPQRPPPLAKIQAWAAAKQFDSTAAFLIARKIAQSGYPANPFVQRTYDWVETRIASFTEPFLAGITAQYVRGRA